MQTKLIWITPEAEKLLAYMARVSNPAGQSSENISGLLKYMVKHKHWSPFEMASAVFEINTTRDIARQILRHRSFSFQEFCVDGDTKITLELPSSSIGSGRRPYARTIKHLFRLQSEGKKMPSRVRVFDESTRTFVGASIKEVFEVGVKPMFKVTLANGKEIVSTKDHKFLTAGGFLSLEEAVGLKVINGTAYKSKECAIACNGTPAYTDYQWMKKQKAEAISSGGGVKSIAEQAGVSYHTIRKWLKRHNLRFTKHEVSSYTPAWNKGLSGYSLGKHSLETIEKMKRSAKRGSDSNLWRGGADRSERLKIADWCTSNRQLFLKSAGYKCTCGSSDNLELHHIEPVSLRPDLAYSFDNIAVMCRKCHRSLHNTLGHPKEWRAKSKGNTLTVKWSYIDKVEYVGERMAYDMEVNHESHNYVANGIVTHNSQRYASADDLPASDLRECRMQDLRNRQSSNETDDVELEAWWNGMQSDIESHVRDAYRQALAKGIAKEVARSLLPEGLTPTRMYMAGTLRSWMHYCQLRTGPETQKEHRLIAESISDTLGTHLPSVWGLLSEHLPNK